MQSPELGAGMRSDLGGRDSPLGRPRERRLPSEARRRWIRSSSRSAALRRDSANAMSRPTSSNGLSAVERLSSQQFESIRVQLPEYISWSRQVPLRFRGSGMVRSVRCLIRGRRERIVLRFCECRAAW
jgi:hypothetical protein